MLAPTWVALPRTANRYYQEATKQGTSESLIALVGNARDSGDAAVVSALGSVDERRDGECFAGGWLTCTAWPLLAADGIPPVRVCAVRRPVHHNGCRCHHGMQQGVPQHVGGEYLAVCTLHFCSTAYLFTFGFYLLQAVLAVQSGHCLKPPGP